jgi:predicted nucleic acid-binding Zn ribbon protein
MRTISPEHLAKLHAARTAKKQAVTDGSAEDSGRFTCGVCEAKVDSCFAFTDCYRCKECAERIFAARDTGHPAGSRIMRDGSILPPTPETLAIVGVSKASPSPAKRSGRFCAVCGVPVTSKRSDAQFCSPACRVASHRAQQAVGQAATVAKIGVLAQS